jgi:hypothetical protein
MEEKFIKKMILEFSNGEVEVITKPCLVIIPNHDDEQLDMHVTEGFTVEDVGAIGDALSAFAIGVTDDEGNDKEDADNS